MKNSASSWFGGASLGHSFMGQNYGNRRRYSKNPYPVSQESVLPPDTLTKEQLEDWEAEHDRKAPPGSHPLRPHPDFPRETQETPKEVKSWVDTSLPSTVEAPIPTTPITPPAPIAPVTTVTPSLPEPTPALPEMVEGPPVATRRSVSNVSDADLMDTYLEKVDGLCQIGEEYTRKDAQDSVRRSNINRAIESVLSSVPYYDRQRVRDLAKEECPEFGELDWAVYFYGEKGPGAMADKLRDKIETLRRPPTAPLPDPIADRVPSFHRAYTPRYDRLKRENLVTPTGPVPLAPTPTEGVKTEPVQSAQTHVQPAPGRGAQPVETHGRGGQQCPPGQFWDGTKCRGSVSSIPGAASLPASGGGPGASLPTGGGAPSALPPALDVPMGPVDVSNLPSVMTGIRHPMTAGIGQAYPVVNSF